MPRIVIALDHTLFSEGLLQLLTKHNDFLVTGVAINDAELLLLLKQTSPDMAIVDVRTPTMDGFRLYKQLLREWPRLKIIAMSMFEDFRMVTELKRIGIHGYIFKTLDADDVLTHIRQVARGRSVFPGTSLSSGPVHISGDVHEDKEKKFSSREREIITLMIQGNTSQQIAKKLFISINTVKNHRKNLLKKVHASNAQELVAYAMTHNIAFFG